MRREMSVGIPPYTIRHSILESHTTSNKNEYNIFRYIGRYDTLEVVLTHNIK